MGDNNIRHADDVAEMLRHNSTITNFVLSENNFSDKDAALLAQVIEVREDTTVKYSFNG